MASNAELAMIIKAQDQASAVLGKVGGELVKLGESGAGLGGKLKGVADSIASLTAGAAVAGVGGLAAAFTGAVTAAAGFEQQMSAIAAVSGASASELAQLQEAALKLGAETSFSAKEAAAGIEELVKAGVSVKDVLGGAAAGALNLAAAGGISVAEAAEIASNALNAFGLKGEDMAHVADVIAGAANASAISVKDYQFSLSAAGAVAATVGVSFEDLSTAIAALGNAGIKGSDAGTSLKTMLMNLQPSTKAQIAEFERLGIATVNSGEAFAQLKAALLQTSAGQQAFDKLSKSNTLTVENLWKAADKLGLSVVAGSSSFERWLAVSGNLGNSFFDATGKAKPLAEIAGVLQTALAGMTEQQKLASLEILFGSDAIRAAAILAKEGAEGMNELAAAIGKVTAEQVAKERLNNLAGAMEQLKGSVETAAITFGLEFLPVLKEIVEAITEMVNGAIPSLKTAGEQAAATFRSWLPAIKEAALALWEHREAIGQVVAALAGMAILITVASWIGSLAAILNPFGIILLAITASIGALGAAWITNWGGIRDSTMAAWEAIQPALAQAVDWLGVQLAAALDWLTTTGWPLMLAAATAVAAWVTQTLIPGITALVDWLGPKLAPVVQWLFETGWPALVEAGNAVSTMVQAVIQFFTDLFTEMEKRGVFTDLHGIWTQVVEIGGKLWPVVLEIVAAIRGLITIVGTFLVGPALGLYNWMGEVNGKSVLVQGVIRGITDTIKLLGSVISSQLSIVSRFLDLLNDLSRIRLPSFNLTGSGISGRAHGGPVDAGTPYIVGERGPELFIPNESGRIEPRVLAPVAAISPTRQIAATGAAGGYDEERLATVIAQAVGAAVATTRPVIAQGTSDELLRQVRRELDREARDLAALRGVI
ncbi:MAG: phage tail tape measure protein [Chloroflexi bacterium]|nr:phage tail tape measure protein [Chloroflexota bacterium]